MAPPSYIHRRYRVLAPLGEGGLGTAYRVWDEATEEERALKVVSGDGIDWLRNEFALLAGLFHPNLLKVHDFSARLGPPAATRTALLKHPSSPHNEPDEPPNALLKHPSSPLDEPDEPPPNAPLKRQDHTPNAPLKRRDSSPNAPLKRQDHTPNAPLKRDQAGFYTSDLLVGGSLGELQATWPARRAALADALAGLAFLHQLGIRHGDFKPENIIVSPSGHATLLDLSCATRLLEPLRELSGTPDFIAPELAIGKPPDARSDLYAVGVTLRRVADPDDAAVHKLVARLTQPDPSRRPAEVADVLAALGEERPLFTVAKGRSPRIVGRDPELATVNERLAAFVRGAPGPRGIVICGDTGTGKSRLLQELKWRASIRCAVAEAARPAHHPSQPDRLRSVLRRAGATLDGSATLTLDAALAAAHELGAGREPVAIFIDDADDLEDRERTHLEAILRSLPNDGQLMLIVAAAHPIATEACEIMALDALSSVALQAWAGDLVGAERTADLHRLTGGNPAYVAAALRQISAGTLQDTDLAEARTVDRGAHVAPAIRGLTEREQSALAYVVASGDQHRHAAFRLATDTVASLVAKGWITADTEGCRLARSADADPIANALGADVMAPAYRLIAERSEDAVTQIDCWLRLDVSANAEAALRTAGRATSRRRSDVLDRLAAATVDEGCLILIAHAQLEMGRPLRALRAIARRMRLTTDGHRRVGSRDAAAYELAGRAYLHQQQPKRAARYLRRALGNDSTEGEAPEITADETRVARLAALVRALNQNGSYEEAYALATAETSIGSALTSDADADLASGLGVSATFLGRSDEAERHLTRAAAYLDETARPRDAARIRSYLAILAFRRGDVAGAAGEYARALTIAEENDVTDMLPTLVLNLGTARQQLGNWGGAMSLYERGRRLAIALGKAPACAIVELNLANLLADIGLAHRAEAMLQRASATMKRAGTTHLEGQRMTIQAEVELARDDPRAASAWYAKARDEHAQRGEDREAGEAAIQLAWWSMRARGDVEGAASQLDRADELLGSMEAEDVRARGLVARGQQAALRGEHATAETFFAKGLRVATGAEQPLIVAETQAVMAAHHVERGRTEDAAPLEDASRERWGRVAETLPRTMRDAFWAHIRRRDVAPDRQLSSHHKSPRVTNARLGRVLELSARITSSLSMSRVLEVAMDAAIELTGAERGFLLLRDDASAEVQVAVARNVDRERLGRGDLEFSTNIAEQVMRDANPVVTLDAQGDARFRSHRSVHAMQLKSVMCVPIAARGATLGALYLDNRFRHGRFDEEDVSVVVAFASHIAMAVKNARLHAELADQHRRLAAEKRRVERLSRGQARTIEKLEARVRDQQRVLEHRYDYTAIVHRSRAMGEVLGILDRVIESDLTVLVEGESGTGKELIARAIHFNSPRREEAFVSVNCGALSETLLESELFGHVRGAFTGADRDRVGLMVAAEGGTLFLDEVGELSLSMQVKLLRALQEREVRPLGAVDPVALDVRVVCATNRHLRDEVGAGRFREDLYYRLGVVEVRIPPLRERSEDVIPIARTILERLAAKSSASPPEIDRAAARALLRYRWPGNVRQLENILARAYFLSDRDTIQHGDLDLSAQPKQGQRPLTRDEFEADEAERIHDTLLQNRWNVSQSARLLGMPRNTLYRKMRRLGIRRGA